MARTTYFLKGNQQQLQSNEALMHSNIRNAQLENPFDSIKDWLTSQLHQSHCPITRAQIIKRQFDILLDVICDECLNLTYRNTCLKLINYPLFWLRELEETCNKNSHQYQIIKEKNNSTFYEFTQTFAFFEKSLRG